MFQDNQRSSLKALSTGVSAMQEQEEIDRGHLSVLQAQVLNFTAKSTLVSMSLLYFCCYYDNTGYTATAAATTT